VKYVLWETEPRLQVCHAFFNSLVVFTLGEDAMRDTIASWTGQVPRDFKRLADSAKFKNIQQHGSKNHDFLAYFNVEEMLNLVGPLLALSPQTAGAYQKLARIQASATALPSRIAASRTLALSPTPATCPSPRRPRNARRSRSPRQIRLSIALALPTSRPFTRK